MRQTSEHQTTLYDTLMIGGGPAGLSAALHLAWHNRKVLVLDRRSGPLFYTLSKLVFKRREFVAPENVCSLFIKNLLPLA